MIYAICGLVLAFIGVCVFMYRRGKAENKAEIVEKTAEVMEKQIEIASKPNRSLKSLLGSMRDNEL